jgi:hypothetical protein
MRYVRWATLLTGLALGTTVLLLYWERLATEAEEMGRPAVDWEPGRPPGGWGPDVIDLTDGPENRAISLIWRMQGGHPPESPAS